MTILRRVVNYYHSESEKVKYMEKLILNIDEVCELTGWGKTKAREILNRPNSSFTIRYGNRLCADKELLIQYIHKCAKYQIKI